MPKESSANPPAHSGSTPPPRGGKKFVDIGFYAKASLPKYGPNSLDKQISRMRRNKKNKDVDKNEANLLKTYIKEAGDHSNTPKAELNRHQKLEIRRKLLDDYRKGKVTQVTYKKFVKWVNEGF